MGILYSRALNDLFIHWSEIMTGKGQIKWTAPLSRAQGQLGEQASQNNQRIEAYPRSLSTGSGSNYDLDEKLTRSSRQNKRLAVIIHNGPRSHAGRTKSTGSAGSFQERCDFKEQMKTKAARNVQ